MTRIRSLTIYVKINIGILNMGVASFENGSLFSEYGNLRLNMGVYFWKLKLKTQTPILNPCHIQKVFSYSKNKLPDSKNRLQFSKTTNSHIQKQTPTFKKTNSHFQKNKLPYSKTKLPFSKVQCLFWQKSLTKEFQSSGAPNGSFR